MRVWALLLLSAIAASAVDRLYLKDGSYQMVREYEIQKDRVRYYSSERGEWEEIPREMVDFERTKKESDDRKAVVVADAKAQDEEDAAIRAERKEVQRVPVEPGAYWIHNDKIEPMKVAESKIVSNKRRTVLKVLSPIPLVAGKSTVELDGASASLRITDIRPEFYFRLSGVDAVAIIKVTPKKAIRLVENVAILPVTNEMIEERQIIPTFKKQAEEGLFKIWPEKALEPGEYALIEYVDGQVNMQVWDFGVSPAK
jgi:hypothetical protein